MGRKATNRSRFLIQKYEGCKLQSYRDSAGIWTVGYGHTGPDVGPKQTITQERALELLTDDMRRAEVAVNLEKLELNQNQFDALVCFVFNVGAHNFRTSTLCKLLRVGNYTEAANEFLKWRYSAGKELKGLAARRAAERELFLENPQ